MDNKTEGTKWIAKAAELDHSRAQYRDALRLLKGIGTEKDEEEGVEWLDKCMNSERDEAERMNDSVDQLGLCYLRGQGVRQSDKEAADLFEEAALADVDSAQFHFGLCLFLGRGTNQSFFDAAVWFCRSQRPPALFLLAICYYEGLGEEKEVELAEAIVDAQAIEHNFGQRKRRWRKDLPASFVFERSLKFPRWRVGDNFRGRIENETPTEITFHDLAEQRTKRIW